MSNSVKYHIQINRMRHQGAWFGGHYLRAVVSWVLGVKTTSRRARSEGGLGEEQGPANTGHFLGLAGKEKRKTGGRFQRRGG